MSVFEVILVRIFPAFSRIRTEYGEIRSMRSMRFTQLILLMYNTTKNNLIVKSARPWKIFKNSENILLQYLLNIFRRNRCMQDSTSGTGNCTRYSWWKSDFIKDRSKKYLYICIFICHWVCSCNYSMLWSAEL